ncbi:MAG: DUF3854 domain-containing protein [Proteobacteria bacterium]|nr:DUF3854 domain-containing protein [Pseudomonadota bacterium]
MSAVPSANVTNVTASSEQFMLSDLMRSGLMPSDFTYPPSPLRPTEDGQARYRLHYTDDYYKDRIDRPESKYVGPKGRPVPMPIIDVGRKTPGAENFGVAAVEGYKKAQLFSMTTGIAAAALDSCWGFGVSTGDDEVRQIRNELLEHLDPKKYHIVLIDGDWQTNPAVAKAIATFALLIEELGMNAVFPDLGIGADGRRRGYDDWFVQTYGTNRSEWPDEKTTLKALLDLPKVPVSEMEVARKLALGTSARFNNSYVDFSDRGNATLFVKLMGRDNLRYITDSKQWAIWEQGRWRLYDAEPLGPANEVARHYYRRAEQLQRIADTVAEDGDRKDKAEALMKQALQTRAWANKQCSSTHGRKTMLEDAAARPDLRVRLADFDADSNILAVSNGVVDLRTGELRAERQEDMILNRCAVPYTEVEPTGEGVDRVKMFVRQITGSAHGVLDAANLSWLQRRLGASLRGMNSLDALEIWHGSGANGKSVLATLVETALGDYAITIPAGVVLSTNRDRDPEAPSPYLMLAINKRIIFMSEAKDTAYLNEQMVKQICGGDRINARGMYQGGGAYNVTFSPILLVNDMPNVAQGDTAFWDRIGTFEFRLRWRRPNRTTWEPEEMDLPVGDLWLRDEAKKDPKALAWILWWMVQGGKEWEAAGKVLGSPPKHIAADVQGYKDAQDRLGHWMADEGWIWDAESRTRSAEVYRSYSEWTLAQGGKPEKDSVFSTRLIKYAKGKLATGKTTGGKGALVGIRRAMDYENRPKY